MPAVYPLTLGDAQAFQQGPCFCFIGNGLEPTLEAAFHAALVPNFAVKRNESPKQRAIRRIVEQLCLDTAQFLRRAIEEVEASLGRVACLVCA